MQTPQSERQPVATTIPVLSLAASHTSSHTLHFLDFVSADGKGVENKMSVWDLSNSPVKIELGGDLNQLEKIYYLISVRVYQGKYEGRDVQKISFRSRTETWVNLARAGAVNIRLFVEFLSLTYDLFQNETVGGGTTGGLVGDGMTSNAGSSPHHTSTSTPTDRQMSCKRRSAWVHNILILAELYKDPNSVNLQDLNPQHQVPPWLHRRWMWGIPPLTYGVVRPVRHPS
ncbi:hypothetical protein BYT27DRAFT_7257249 [Phlegmacium glaucopus]|nr:hypothetical protein BYT27DRAFT_7257249 [Phlegmacium glaucopus]